jgi:hypothetical protein
MASTTSATTATSASSTASSTNSGSIDTKRRVKYYVLNDARQWVDRGTGHVSWIYNDRQRSVSLMVFSKYY